MIPGSAGQAEQGGVDRIPETSFHSLSGPGPCHNESGQ
jgi:hypothetical protein